MTLIPSNLETLPTRERLLWSALICFSRKGYYQTTTDEIVAESGLGKGTLYRHFGNKKELFISLVQWVFETIGQQMMAFEAEELTAAEQLRSIVIRLMADTERLLPFYRITLDYWAHTIEDVQVRHMFSAVLHQFQLAIVPIIEAGVASGEFRPVEAKPAVLALIAMLDGLGLYKALLLDDFDLTGAVTTLTDIFIAGLRNSEL